MIGTSFFRSTEEKCPRCGTYGEPSDSHDADTTVCPTCDTQFNEYVILWEGNDIEFQNH